MWGLKSASSRTMSHLQGTLKSCSTTVRTCFLTQRHRAAILTSTRKNLNIQSARWANARVSTTAYCLSVEQNPGPLRGTRSRARAACWLYLAGAVRPSSGSFPTRELLFHVPVASLNIRGSDCQEPTGGPMLLLLTAPTWAPCAKAL